MVLRPKWINGASWCWLSPAASRQAASWRPSARLASVIASGSIMALVSLPFDVLGRCPEIVAALARAFPTQIVAGLTRFCHQQECGREAAGHAASDATQRQGVRA